MNGTLTLLILVSLLLFSCKKEEQSCTDGVFTPEKEEKVDCGGVCPPCNFQPTIIDTYLSAKVNGESISFSNYTLSKSPDWILSFENDSLNIQVNLGSGDSLGGRPMEVPNSKALFHSNIYSSLGSGYSVFAEIDHIEQSLSAFFNAKFVSDNDINDTLRITDGEFQKINW